MVPHFELPAHFIGHHAHRLGVYQLAIKQTREQRLAGVSALLIAPKVSREPASEKASVTAGGNESTRESETRCAVASPVPKFKATAAIFVPAPKPVSAALNPKAMAFEPLRLR